MSRRHHRTALCTVLICLAPSVVNAQAETAPGGWRRGPDALVERWSGERDERSSIAFYQRRNLPGDGAISWHAETSFANGSASLDSASCPAVFEAVTSLERLPLPRVELRIVELPRGSTPEPPNLGRLHASYRAELDATSAEGGPIRLTLEEVGTGPIQRWFDQAEPRLGACLEK